MLASGSSLAAASRALGVHRATIRLWRDRPEQVGRQECPRCDGSRLDAAAYSLLLGFYLGDGCISQAARCQVLRVSCDAKYVGIIDDVSRAVKAVRPDGAIHHVKALGARVVQSAWVHWHCLFPQDGDGPKHRRSLTLADWQSSIVEQHPGPFLRGLFHSDGCRATNIIRAPGSGRTYSYSRWQFSNRSEDIHAMCQWALDLVGVEWKRTGWHTCVSGREAVARLEGLIGLKT